MFVMTIIPVDVISLKDGLNFLFLEKRNNWDARLYKTVFLFYLLFSFDFSKVFCDF